MRSSRVNLLFGALFAFALLLSIVSAHGGHGGHGHSHHIPDVAAQVPKHPGQQQQPVQIDELDDEEEDVQPLASGSNAEPSTVKSVELPTFTVLFSTFQIH